VDKTSESLRLRLVADAHAGAPPFCSRAEPRLVWPMPQPSLLAEVSEHDGRAGHVPELLTWSRPRILTPRRSAPGLRGACGLSTTRCR